jgi:hypothetical protein
LAGELRSTAISISICIGGLHSEDVERAMEIAQHLHSLERPVPGSVQSRSAQDSIRYSRHNRQSPTTLVCMVKTYYYVEVVIRDGALLPRNHKTSHQLILSLHINALRSLWRWHKYNRRQLILLCTAVLTA